MAENREFAEQIGAAVASLGTNDTLGCMTRVCAGAYQTTIKPSSSSALSVWLQSNPSSNRCKVEGQVSS